MTDNQPADVKNEALQAVFDRVASWQDGATDSTVEAELRKALGEAGIELDDADAQRIADHIENDGSHVDVDTLVPPERVRHVS